MTATIDTNNETMPPLGGTAGAAPLTFKMPLDQLSVVDVVLSTIRPELEAALPDETMRASLEVAVIQAAVREPELQQCDPKSLADAVLTFARLKLIPEGQDGHCTLVARADKDRGGFRAEALVMVRGLQFITIRDGNVSEYISETVRMGEEFRYRPIEKAIEHEPGFPRGKEIVAAYAIALMKGGVARIDGPARAVEVVDQRELQAARSASRGNIAWESWEAQMSRKTAVRRLIFSHGLLAPASLGALAKATIELDERVGRAPELVAAAPEVKTLPPSVTGTDAGAGPSKPASSKAAQKVLDSIAAAKAARGGSAPPAAPASPPPAPAQPKPKAASEPAKAPGTKVPAPAAKGATSAPKANAKAPTKAAPAKPAPAAKKGGKK